ncbi:MAG: aldehyde dehydrogenase family protein [Pseudomonadota bacterium]
MGVTINPAAIGEQSTGPSSYQLLINGERVDGADGATLDRHSPGHGVPVSRYALAGPSDVERAILAARKAFDTGPWPTMKASERAGVLTRTASLMADRADELARLDALESGKPISQAQGEVAGAIDIWNYAASLARTLHGESYGNLGDDMLGLVLREPIGVVSIITPWNFPLLIVSQKLPFALAAGCTAVVKPSEMTSASTLVLGDLLHEAGLPEGVVNILVGHGAEVGAPMVEHPAVDMVSFTGSTRVGKQAMAAASGTLKKVSMELGGKNAQIVFPDADLEAALDAVVFGAYFNAGECCNAGSRLLIHRSIADDFVAQLIELGDELAVGDPLAPSTQVGAIITEEHLSKVEAYVSMASESGAEVSTGGRRLNARTGHYMAPTVVQNVDPAMAIAREEVFGPVLSVMTFDDLDGAIKLSRETDFGLSASVWSRDIDTCVGFARAARTGTVWVNTFMDGYPELPFGGYKQSGLGRELGVNAVEDFAETKTVQIHQGERTNWWVRPRGNSTA